MGIQRALVIGAGTGVGRATARYGAGSWPVALDRDEVARAILSVASGEGHRGVRREGAS
jgi:hypothetical protein